MVNIVIFIQIFFVNTGWPAFALAFVMASAALSGKQANKCGLVEIWMYGFWAIL